MPGAEGGGIFVSYRRQDSEHLAGRLYDGLADRFGKGRVFMDVETIEPGVNFAEEISQAVAACQVLVAVIGAAWLAAADERGRRRLDDPDDFVRLEIETALARGVRVIPVLAQGAVMPGRDDLPRSLADLAHRNALSIRHERFRSDTERLLTTIERVLAAGTAAAMSASDTDDARSSGKAVGELGYKSAGPTPNDLARATDPDRAEHLARTITDEYSKASALSGVAGALAATDPDRATRLFTEAERFAHSITDRKSKAEALSGIATALAVTDTDRAERLARTITDEFMEAMTLSDIATALADTDPDRAERIAHSIIDENQHAEALSSIAKVLVATSS